METVFNRPVTSVEIENPGWIGFLGNEAGDSVNDLFGGLVLFQMGYLTAYAQDLPDVWKIEVIVQVCAGPDFSYFKSPMPLMDGLVLRGENRPCSRPRYQTSEWVDCL